MVEVAVATTAIRVRVTFPPCKEHERGGREAISVVEVVRSGRVKLRFCLRKWVLVGRAGVGGWGWAGGRGPSATICFTRRAGSQSAQCAFRLLGPKWKEGK